MRKCFTFICFIAGLIPTLTHAIDIKQTFISQQYLNQSGFSTGYAFGHNPNFVIDDFDKNGYLDIMSFPSNYITPDGSYQFKPVTWLNNNGVFTATDTVANGVTTQFARDIIIDDFNDDGFNDYITVDQGFEPNRDQGVSDFKMYYPNLMLGTSNGVAYVAMADWNKSLDSARVFNHIGDSADFDGDGDKDFAIASFGTGVKIYQNNGDGTFTGKDNLIPQLNNASGLSFVQLADGNVGLIVGMYASNESPTHQTSSAPQVYAYENGGFVLKQTLSRLEYPGVDPFRQGMVDTKHVDINGDGREDLLLLWETPDSPTHTYMSVYIQNADSTFTKKTDLQITYPSQDATSSIQVADLDKDGDLDFYVLAAGADGGYRITELDQAIWLNDGFGNFSHPTNFFNLIDYVSTRWEDKFGLYLMYDINNDGVLDVVAVSSIFASTLDKTLGQEVTVFIGTANLPGAPTITRLTPGNGSIRIVFNPPANTGGAAISSYTASCSGSGVPTRANSGTSSPITVTGLTNGVSYTCTVRATNSAGTGAPSGGVPKVVRPVSIAPILSILND